MIRSYDLRLIPTQAQRASFADILRDSCETYNAALQERRDAYRMAGKSITYNDQTKELTELRQDPRFATIAIEIQREPLRRVDRAFKAFFRRCRTGEKPGYPRFRSRDRYDSFAWGPPSLRPDNRLLVPRLGFVRFKTHRPIEGTPKQVTIRRVGKKRIARVACDIGPAPEKRAVSRAVGIDVGLTTLVTLSDGTAIENPRWTRKHAGRVAAAQRLRSRKQRRSNNRIRAKEIVRRAYQRQRDARANYLHHASKWLVENYDLIAYEDLKIRNMVRSKLAKSIHDVAWGQLLFQVGYKAESAGVHFVAVNPRGTSIRCSSCGADVPKTLADRQHVCGCGLSLNRDHNAAINILKLAPGSGAAGVRPSIGPIRLTTPDEAAAVVGWGSR